jgi:hypothetical protein
MSDAASSTTAGISARGLTKRYERGRIRAVEGLDLDIVGGEFVAICGPSACGKTTLLNLIAAIDRPDAGVLHVAGRSLAGLSAAEADQFRRSVVGLIFQLHNLLPDLTALENVQVPMLGTGRPTGPAHGRRCCPAANASGSGSPGLWRTSRGCCWRTSRPGRSIRGTGSVCSTCSTNCSATYRLHWSSSHTIRISPIGPAACCICWTGGSRTRVRPLA